MCYEQELLDLQQHVLLGAVHQTFSFQTTGAPVVLWQAARKEGAPCHMVRAGDGHAPPGSSAVRLGQQPLVVAVSWPCGICFLLSGCCAHLLQMARGSTENRVTSSCLFLLLRKGRMSLPAAWGHPCLWGCLVAPCSPCGWADAGLHTPGVRQTRPLNEGSCTP